MTIEIQAPDGSLVRFPDGTPDDTIVSVMRQNFGGPQGGPGPVDTAIDVAKSAGVGIGQGVIGLATLPGNIEQLGRMGINKVAELAGAEGPVVGEESFIPNYGDVKGAIERNVTGEFYQPKTTAGDYARTGGEFASLALGGPAGWANRAARVAVPAGVSETAGQLTEGTSLEPWARVAGALGGGMAAGAAQRVVSPLPTDPARQAAVRTLEGEGVTALTAGQRTGRPSLRWAESMSKDTAGSGGRAAQMELRQAEQFTRAALRRIGVDADRATPDVMFRAHRDIGQRFNDLAARNSIRPGRLFDRDLRDIQRQYESVTAPAMRAPLVEQTVAQLIDPALRQNGLIPGRLYQNMRSELSQQAHSLMARDPAAGRAVRQIVDRLDNAMEGTLRATRSPDAGRWRQARGQYRNLLAIEDAVSGAGEAAAAGLISPSMLRNAVKKQGKRAYVQGQGDFAQLARSGEQVMKALPQSGTAPRINAMNLLHSVGAVAGYGAGGIEGAIAGVLAPALGSRALMSGPMQNYLANQRAAGAALRQNQADPTYRGLLALPGAMDAGLLGDY